MDRLQTPAAAVAHALVVLRRRGSLVAAEELTGHTDETSGRPLRHAAAPAEALTEALTEALVPDRHRTEVEVAEVWSFVQQKGALPQRPAPPRPVRPVPGSAGGA